MGERPQNLQIRSYVFSLLTTMYISRTSLATTRSLCSLPKQRLVLLVCCRPLSEESVPLALGVFPSFSFKIQCLPLVKVPRQWLFQHRLTNEILSTRWALSRERWSLIRGFCFVPNFWITVFHSSNERIPGPQASPAWGVQPLPVINVAE